MNFTEWRYRYRHSPNMGKTMVIDETSHLKASDFADMHFGRSWLKPPRGPIYVAIPSNYESFPKTEEDAPHLPIWSRNDEE